MENVTSGDFGQETVSETVNKFEGELESIKKQANTKMPFEKQQKQHQTKYPGIYSCPFCPAGFPEPEQYVLHEVQQHGQNTESENGNNKYQCTRCPRSFNRKRNILKHFMQIHLKLKPKIKVTSKTEDKAGKYWNSDEDTKIGHNAEPNLTSSICKTRPNFSKLKSNNVPLDKAAIEPLSTTSVSVSSHSTTENFKLVNHDEMDKVNVTPNDDNDVKQDDYDLQQSFWALPKILKTFSLAEYLPSSARPSGKYGPLGNFNCDICKTSFGHRILLTKHMKLAHNQRIIFECKQCSIKLIHYNSIKRHMIKQHGYVFPNREELISEQNVSISYISMDQIINLNNERKRDSIECGAMLNENIAEGNFIDKKKAPGKRYRCGFPGCVKGFKCADSLKTHQWKHVGYYPFHCDWEGCTWKFVRKRDLRQHYRRHTKEKPYSCQICQRNFARNDNLGKHMQNIHK